MCMCLFPFDGVTEPACCCFSDNDYTEVNGLQRDMAPAVGALAVKTVVIEKNDNAEGIIEFENTVVSGEHMDLEEAH